MAILTGKFRLKLNSVPAAAAFATWFWYGKVTSAAATIKMTAIICYIWSPTE